MDALEEKRFNTGEIEINYVVGPNNGPSLVLVPPQGIDWKTYQKVLPLLIPDFHVYSLDIRGHGKSDWATGDYSFTSIGRDMTAFLEDIVKEPAIISGNSSGGLIALWLAANRPSLVKAIIMEDPPLFSAEWPRIKEDSYVYRVLQVTVEMKKELHESRSISGLARLFMKVKRPLPDGRIRSIPSSAAYLIAFLVRATQMLRGRPSLPGRLGTLTDVLVDFDADFSQAWLDGRIYEGLDHAEALKRAECPMLLLHANWVRHPDFGLVGAMDDDDAAYARELAPEMHFKRIESEHVVHSYNPEQFVEIVNEFVKGL
jgi:pimeloyl-ACP methyl ester carboxylesterase